MWRLPATVGAVFGALDDLAGYPEWWPEIRGVRRVDDDRALVTCRSVLPYTLVLELARRRSDPAAGVLEVGIYGDLEGFARFTLSPDGPTATRALFEQEVEARRPLLRRRGRVARRLFETNHAVMMRRGEQGLRRHLYR